MSFIDTDHHFNPGLILDSHTELIYHVSLVPFYLYLSPFLFFLSLMTLSFY